MFGHNDIGRKLTKHNVAWAEAYLPAKWHLDPSSRLATIDMGRKLGGCAPFSWGGGAGFPSNTKSPWPRSTSVPSDIFIHPAVWPQKTWAENWGCLLVSFFGWRAGSLSNTKSLWPRPTSISSRILIHPAVWSQWTWAENWGWGCAPLGRESWIPIKHNVAGAEAYPHAKFHLDLSNRLATIHKHRRQDRQRSDSIGRTVLQTVAQKVSKLYSQTLAYVLCCKCSIKTNQPPSKCYQHCS